MKRCHRHSAHIPRVIALVSMQSNYGPSVLRGIFAHIAAHGEWGLEIIRSGSDLSVDTIRQAIAHKTDGCIIAYSKDYPDVYQALVDSQMPFTTVECYSDILLQCKYNAQHIRIDNHTLGRDAARDFLRQGQYSTFGFVPPRNEHPWSTARGEGYGEELTRRNRCVATFSGSSTPDTVSRRGDLAKWLRRLDKPAAIFAADDDSAFEVIQACQSALLKIPDEIAVLGVDDDPLICENIRPTLSSIRPAFADAGRAAAEALERLMHKRSNPAAACITVAKGRSEIVTRDSTRPESSAGLLVQKAISFIQANARLGIGIEDVRAHLGVSRALMDLRFREVRNETVLAVLTDARLKELKHALKFTDEPIAEITARLGWTSPNYPKRLFKKRFGCSMLTWRKFSKA